MTIKDLNVEKLRELSPQTLYNLLFGPVAEMKRELEQNGTSNSVVAVYGATIIPIQRRIQALTELVDKSNIDSIIFSGGFGWQGVPLKDKKKEEIKEFYAKPDVVKRILNRTKDIINNCPELEQRFVFDSFGYSGMGNEDLKELILDKMYHDPIFCNYAESLYKKENKDSNLSFSDWMDEYFSIMLSNYILNKITESEIMQILWNRNLEAQNIDTILESNSSDTRDNARYSINKFLERKKENPKLDTLIVINEWPYLQRAVLTTKKIAKDMGVDINVVGYPACFDKDKEWYYSSYDSFLDNPVSGVITNLSKQINYKDSPNFNIDRFLSCAGLYEGGPNIATEDTYLKDILGDGSSIKK